jgi:hypothetical protein
MGGPFQGAYQRGQGGFLGGARREGGMGRYEPQLYGPMEGGPMGGYMEDPMGMGGPMGGPMGGRPMDGQFGDRRRGGFSDRPSRG